MSPLWPNLFVVGVARAGTSSLAAYLGQHPDIFVSPFKEPYFFSDTFMPYGHFPKDDDAYLALFEGGEDARWRAEASTAYFWDPTAAERIAARCPQARIVISLREPVSRAYSGYWHAVENAGEARPFPEVVRAELEAGRWRPESGVAPGHVEAGWYLDGLERWSGIAGPHLHILFFEDLARDPTSEMRRLFDFLGVGPGVADRIDTTARNRSVAPRSPLAGAVLRSPPARFAARHLIPRRLHRRAEGMLRADAVPPIPEETRRTLATLYEAERAPLEAFLGRRLAW